MASKKVPTHLLIKSDDGEGKKVPCNNARETENFSTDKKKVDCKDCKAYIKMSSK